MSETVRIVAKIRLESAVDRLAFVAQYLQAFHIHVTA